MKRIIVITLATVFAVVGLTTPADAASKKCVTAKEYRHLHATDPMATVQRKFGTAGSEFDSYVQPVYDYYEVDTDGDGYADTYTQYVAFYATDIVQVYKKCKSFDGGKGKVAINFNDYTYATDVNDYTQRAVQRVRYDPFDLDYYGGTYYFRKAAPTHKG